MRYCAKLFGLLAGLKAAVGQETCTDFGGQCGGLVPGNLPYQGPGCCAPFVCLQVAAFYSQCEPAPRTLASTSTSTTSLTTTTVTETSSTTSETTSSTSETSTTSETTSTASTTTTTATTSTTILQDDAEGSSNLNSLAINPIVTKGNFLYDAVTQKRFFARGIDYNPQPASYSGDSQACTGGKPKLGPFPAGSDLISDDLEQLWSADLDAIAELGANTIRVYDVDPQKSHQRFMAKAARLGLYVVVPLTRASWGFLAADLPAPECYVSNITGYGSVGTNLVTSARLIVKQFSKYNNTLMFTVGSQVEASARMGYAALPCVKALTRDIHKFQTECASHMRRVPLLYAATDTGGDNRRLVAEYMTCDLNPSNFNNGASDAVDVYGLNVYSYCDEKYLDDLGTDNFEWSPYYQIYRDMGGFAKPIIFTEFGCNVGHFATSCPYKGGRTWPQVKVMTTSMVDVLSGAIAFEYSMEGSGSDNQFGIVLKPGFLEGQDALVKLDQYYALQKAFKETSIPQRWNARWTDSTRCSWSPSVGPYAIPKFTSSGFKRKKTQSNCPSMGELSILFQQQYDAQILPNWLVPLADAPDVSLQCPSYVLGALVQAENQCGVPQGASNLDVVEVKAAAEAQSVAERESRTPVEQVIRQQLTASFLIQNLCYENLTGAQTASLRAVYASGIHRGIYGDKWAEMDAADSVVLEQGDVANSTRMSADVPLLAGQNISQVNGALSGSVCSDLAVATVQTLGGDSLAVSSAGVTVALLAVDLKQPLSGPGSAVLAFLRRWGALLLTLSLMGVLVCAGALWLYQSQRSGKRLRAVHTRGVVLPTTDRSFSPAVDRAPLVRPPLQAAPATTQAYPVAAHSQPVQLFRPTAATAPQFHPYQAVPQYDGVGPPSQTGMFPSHLQAGVAWDPRRTQGALR